MDEIHKKEYRIRDLPTRTVTLFPTRAQVVRDIKDVPLRVGRTFPQHRSALFPANTVSRAASTRSPSLA